MRTVRINSGLDIGGIAALDVIGGNLIAASDSAYRALSLRLALSWNDIPATVMGALMVGVAIGDLTDAQIEECIEATTSIDRADVVANERANRRVRILGTFPSLQGAAVVDQDLNLFEGRTIKVKLNWLVPIGSTIKMWGYNASPTTYANGSNLKMIGTATVAYT